MTNHALVTVCAVCESRSFSCTFLSLFQVRTVSAKALGAMVKGMGESCFDDLLPWLMETLASEQSSVDRSGAAQGLLPFSFCAILSFNNT